MSALDDPGNLFVWLIAVAAILVAFGVAGTLMWAVVLYVVRWPWRKDWRAWERDRQESERETLPVAHRAGFEVVTNGAKERPAD